jgi:(p)ppGpp synthase/HD superfamily hydrolase
MLSPRFKDAFDYAAQLHSKQLRKGTQVPYIAHLMAVAALVFENGGDVDQAIAALLHDAVEDQGGYETLEEIQQKFGTRVAHIVDGCTDAYTDPKPPWRKRKEDYLTRLYTADADIQIVSLADKLHNARCLLADLQKDGETVWSRFKGGKEGTLWYYRQLANHYEKSSNNWLAEEYIRVVAQIEQTVQK